MKRFKSNSLFSILLIVTLATLLACSSSKNLSKNTAGISNDKVPSTSAVELDNAAKDADLPALSMDSFDKCQMNVVLNGKLLSFDVQPIVESNRTLVPIRKIFESLGMEVTWNNDTQTATASDDKNTVIIQIGKSELTTNGKAYPLDVPAKVISDRTMVPLRAISESLDLSVDWFKYASTVFINSDNTSQYYADGTLKYFGQVNSKGQKDGFGKEYSENGKIKYAGQWSKDVKNGVGTFTWESSDTYEGDLTEGQPNGYGVLTHYGIGTYNGKFSTGKRNGSGTFTWLNGDKYVGNWANDKMDGAGIYTFADGIVWSGQWSKNQFLG